MNAREAHGSRVNCAWVHILACVNFKRLSETPIFSVFFLFFFLDSLKTVAT